MFEIMVPTLYSSWLSEGWARRSESRPNAARKVDHLRPIAGCRIGGSGFAGGCSGWILCMSFDTKCWSRGGRSGRSPVTWVSARHGPEVRGSGGPDTGSRRRRLDPGRLGRGRRARAGLLTESVRWTGGKQRLTATRLHELLLTEGHHVGVTVVKDAVAEWKRQRREVFVPLTYRPGDLAEVDFFEVLVDVDGTRRKAWLFLMRLMYSGARFSRGSTSARIKSAFSMGTSARLPTSRGRRRVAYDNLRAAVVRILVAGARTLTPRFTALASHYLVEPCFCRPGEGHDKGGVEARGKAVRQQVLVPIPVGPTLAAINRGCWRSGCAARHEA